MSASLQNAAINLMAIREQARDELGLVLDSIRGRKALVLDPFVSGPLGLVAGVSMLREHGVEQIYLLEDSLKTESQNVIYLVRPLMTNMAKIAGHINAHTRKGQRKEYAVYFCPRRTMICERVLEEKGVYADVSIGEFHMDLVPFDDDVLSLELSGSYLECNLQKDFTSLFYVARALMKIQAMFGVIPFIRGQGRHSQLVADMLLRMRREAASEDKGLLSEIDSLILIDRSLDMVTPQLTQLTYEGLIDEMFGIQNSYVDFEPEVVMVGEEKKNIPKMNGKLVKTPLNSNDALYVELRDLNLTVVGRALHNKAKEVDQYYKTRENLDSLSEIRGFMVNLSGFQQMQRSTQQHANILEKIILWTRAPGFNEQLEAEQGIMHGQPHEEFVDKLINMEKPIERVLRLLILRSMCEGGIKQKRYDQLRHDIIEVYGFQYLVLLQRLELLKLFYPHDRNSVFLSLKRQMNLLDDSIDETNPQDISYVYSGYAPISVRILQSLQNTTRLNPANDKAKIDSIVSHFPGPTVVVNQNLGRRHKQQLEAADVAKGKKVTMVFFIGGCTFTEISAIRFLGSRDEKRQYIIGTTKMINGDSMINSLMDN